jgi:hypothetical protein
MRVAHLGLLGLMCVLARPPALAQRTAGESPVRVEAAFLRNFARYVSWPPTAFAHSRSPWRVGVLGEDPFGDVLERTLAGRTEQSRPFEVVRSESADALAGCHIVYVAHKDTGMRRAALAVLRTRPILTVGEASDFLREGGIVRFQLRDRVVMSVNLDQARASTLEIHTPMLEVSDEVLENGRVRSVR